MGEGEAVVPMHGLSPDPLAGGSEARQVQTEIYWVFLPDLPSFGAMRRSHRRFTLAEAASCLLS